MTRHRARPCGGAIRARANPVTSGRSRRTAWRMDALPRLRAWPDRGRRRGVPHHRHRLQAVRWPVGHCLTTGIAAMHALVRILIAGVALAALPAFAQVKTDPAPDRFDAADANHDGKVDRAEYDGFVDEMVLLR